MVINSDASAAHGYVNFEKRAEKVERTTVAEQPNKTDEFVWKNTDTQGDKSKYVNLPTKKYIDSVIKSALKNIEMGVNVDENKRIINIFSNIINEEPAEAMKSSYIV